MLWAREGPSFEPVCDELESCRIAASSGRSKPGDCLCSGHSNGGPLLPNLEMVDQVAIPKDLRPGKYGASPPKPCLATRSPCGLYSPPVAMGLR